jgi:hypothetical protein
MTYCFHYLTPPHLILPYNFQLYDCIYMCFQVFTEVTVHFWTWMTIFRSDRQHVWKLFSKSFFRVWLDSWINNFRNSSWHIWKIMSLINVTRTLGQWSSTWGVYNPDCKRSHLLGYSKTFFGICKIKKKLLFRDKHWIIRSRCRVSHRASGRNDIRLTVRNHLNI